ncbi:MAG TPA: pitrilysin family protein, partial [Hanamia sp.]|nr:pitrilysin family protein [Hanamia sp.]
MKLKYFIFSLVIICYSFTLCAQKYEWKQATSNGYTYKYVTNDPMKARFYTLKNGLSVILTENHKEPRIAVNIAVRTGSNNDPRDHTGLAHYLEHLLFKGTDKFGTLNWTKEKPYLDSIADLFEKYGHLTDSSERRKMYHQIDRISGEASKYSIANEYDKLMSDIGSQRTNAHTWYEETVFEEDIPSNSLDKFLMIEAERFRRPVFRLFHTELEAVYEEKNRGLDNDANKVHEAMMYSIFPTNNYGQQTTIGTVENLKNPSLKSITKYYNTYYVPNNMAVIMAGDFNPDALIKEIDQQFSYMQPKALHPYDPAPEKPITKITEKIVYGPSAESVDIGFRTPAANTHDALVLSMISNILSNGSAGLLDIDLNQNQKVQNSGAYLEQNKDYGVFNLVASPKEGQSLDTLKALLLEQLGKIKSGNFDHTLLKAIVANDKLENLKGMESNANRLNSLMNSFIK